MEEGSKPPVVAVIAIIGFGTFGQFCGSSFKALHGSPLRVVATSRTAYGDLGLIDKFYADAASMLAEEKPSILLFCTSILSLKSVLEGFPWDHVEPDTLVVECCSVKGFPKSICRKVIPQHLSVLLTHPMFGPNSADVTQGALWTGLRVIFDRSLLSSSSDAKAEYFLDLFRARDCTIVEMTSAEHDAQAAGSQFLTHFISRALTLPTTDVDTGSYMQLKGLLQQVASNSDDLFEAMYRCNASNCESVLDRLEASIQAKRQELQALGPLHLDHEE
jgi:prephenate dehydrogenase